MIQEFMWLPWHYPVPAGWREVKDQVPCHHHQWSRLIMREVDP